MRSFASPKALELYGRGAQITAHLKGRQIEECYKNGIWLILRMVDGHEYRIGWQDVKGNQLKGEPFLENQDARIILTGVSMSGES